MNSTGKILKVFDDLLIYGFAIYIFCLLTVDSCLQEINFFGLIAYNVPYIIFLFLIAKIIIDCILKRNKLFEMLAYILVIVFLGYVYLNSKDIKPLIIFLFMIGLKNVDFDKFIKYTFYSFLISFLLIFLLSSFNIISQNNIDRGGRGLIDGLRHSFGFLWPTFAPNYYMVIVLLYILYKKELKVYDYIIISIINILIYLFTDTKCAPLCVFLSLILYFILNIKNELIYKVVGIFTIALPAIASIFMTYTTKAYSQFDPFLVKLNSIFTGRLKLGHDGFRRWNISLFGQVIDMNINDGTYNFVDCSYLKILFRLGIVLLIVVIIMYMVYAYAAYKTNQKLLLIVIFVMLVHSMIEPQLLAIAYNPTIVLFLMFLWKLINNKFVKNVDIIKR